MRLEGFAYLFPHECIWAWSTWRSEEGVRSLGTRVIDGWEPPCECWKSNPGPLQEQGMLLPTESSLLS